MPRKKQNGADDDAPPPAGDNSAKAAETTDVLGQVIAECYLGYAELMSERTRINWDIAAHFDAFEARGIKAKEKKAIRGAYSDAHNNDKSSAKEQHLANVRVKLALEHITLADNDWTNSVRQDDLFASTAAIDEIAYRAAYDVGRKDAATHCLVKSLNPNVHGTRSWQGWDDGWDRGAEDRKNADLPAPDRTERKKAGRPKKAAATRDPAEPPAADMDEAPPWSREHLGADLPEPPAQIR